VTGLVGDHLNISLCAVEIGKDEGNPIIPQAGAIAATRLTFGRENIQKLVIQHHTEKLAGLGR
jgi:hypothetical protein